ncbi:DUF461 domain-containing protein [Streptomyces sp. MST-110588]|uniref:DUF461 domain-containing protein n=1 Tax=Streptomyces sp. MST-110588 TaxID=2833628 RepID=UPI001F5DF4AB|nr:DUF461 domain-containing protein [Streptomyces sp. MST-110588]UNO40471.1 DUF461 domain-containing protein [Streptomyces sp. MST-110588]
MSRSLRRGVLAATVLTLSIASLSACAAGNEAQTLQVKPDNAQVTSGDIKIQNASVVTQPDADAKGPAVVTATLFNSGANDQTLRSIKVVGTDKEAKLSSATGSGPITVPAGGSIVIGGKGNASAVLTDARGVVKEGAAQRLSFDLSAAGEVKLRALVVPAKGYFKDFGPSELPTPSGPATPSNTASPSGTPSGSPGTATPSNSASASGSPSGAATTPAHNEHGEH